MGEKVLKVMVCPSCGFSVQANLSNDKYRFFIYKCPSCYNNVVWYKNKIDILSDKLVRELLESKNVQYCGMVTATKKSCPSYKKQEGISEDDIANLKILLETERDSGKIISKL